MNHMENGSLKLKVLAIQNLSDVMIIVNIMYYYYYYQHLFAIVKENN